MHVESPTKRPFNDVLCGTATLARFILPYNVYVIVLSPQRIPFEYIFAWIGYNSRP